MKSKTLAIVLAVAAASVGGAYVALSRGTRTAEFEPGAVFFADLGTKSGTVDRIELDRGGKRLELVRVGSQWTLATSDGYPARFEEIKGLVSGLAGLKGDQKMTARKERHAELALAWPDDAGRAARVRLLAGSDPVLDVVLGEERAKLEAQIGRLVGMGQNLGLNVREMAAAVKSDMDGQLAPIASLAASEWEQITSEWDQKAKEAGMKLREMVADGRQAGRSR